MSVVAVTPDAERVAYLIKNLRERDREEIFALRWNDSTEELVRDVLMIAGDMSRVWEVDHTPVAIQGTVPRRPGVWANWCFGTKRWPEALVSMTRWARGFVMPALLRAEFHRADCSVLATNTDAIGWIERCLGGRRESVQRGAGREGEDFVTYVWFPEDVRRVLL